MKFLLHLIGLLVASVCLANVIRVPEDYGTISQAVYSATSGDTILIGPGNFIISQAIEIDKSISILGTRSTDGHQNETVIELNDCIGFHIDPSANGSDLQFSYLNFSSLANYTYYSAIESYTFGGSVSIYRCNFSVNNVPLNIFSDTISIVDSVIQGTTHITLSSPNGGGKIYLNGNVITGNYNAMGIRIGQFINDSLLVKNCIFKNISIGNDGITFGGIGVIKNCVFKECLSYGNMIGTSGNIDLTNNILWNCYFNHQNSCLIRTYANGYPSSTILSYNCLEFGPSYLCNGDSDDNIAYSDGNVELNPNLDPTSFHLLPGSPCIDAGDPNSPLDPDGTRADIGAYYFCQGEGISLPDIVRTSTEPGYPEPITATLQSTCDAVVIDSARTDTGLFSLDSYPSQVAGEFQSGDFNLTFHPSAQGVFTDTLHIWADTYPPHLKVPLVGEAGPIPAPVTDLSISILPDLSAQLTWSPVTQTIYGNPVTPDYYLIFYNELNPQDEDLWYYLYPVTSTTFTHPMVARFASLMNYRVVAWKGIDPVLLGWESGMKMADIKEFEK